MPVYETQQSPFTFGLAEGVDPRQVPFGTLLTAENVVWRKQGRAEKRYGTTALTKNIVGGGTIGAAARLITRGNELALIDGTNLYNYSAVAGGWRNTGPISEVGLTWSTLTDAATGVLVSDMARLNNGLIVHVWATGDVSRMAMYQIVDPSTGSLVTPPTALGIAANAGLVTLIKVVTDGTNWVAIWNDPGNLHCSVNGGAVATLRTDTVFWATGTVGGQFDATVIGSNFVVCYERVSGTNKLALYSYSFASPPVQQATQNIATETSSGYECISISGSAADNLYVTYATNVFAQGVRYCVQDPVALTQTHAPVTIDTGGGFTRDSWNVGIQRTSSSTAILAWSAAPSYPGADPGDPLQDGYTSTQVVTNAGVLSALRQTTGVYLVSRPFVLGGTIYMVVSDSNVKTNPKLNVVPATAAQIGTYLCAVETNTLASNTWPHRYVGRIDLLIGAMWFNPNSIPPMNFVTNAVIASSTQAYVGTPFQSTANQVATAVGGNTVNGIGPFRTGVRLVSVAIGASRPADFWRSAPVASDVTVVGGVLQAYDGRRAFDYGFPVSAQANLGSGPGGAAASMAAGNYLYSVVPEYRSCTGLLYRGPTTAGFTLSPNTAPNASVALKLIVPSLSNNKAPSSVQLAETILTELAIYRSVVNGTTPQRLSAEPTLNFLTSNYQTSPASFTDTRADSDIGNNIPLAARPVLYTVGGELDDHQPVAGTTLVRHRNRIFLVAGDQKTIWFTKDYTSNVGVAPGFNPNQILVLPDNVTALSSMDEKLIIFSATGIWYLLGDGPDVRGQNSDYGSPNRIQTDVGCINPRSVVSTSDGIVFQSLRGIYLLTRGLELVWIGQAVRDELAAFPNITAATLVAAHNEIRICANNTGGTNGIEFRFNYIEKQWSTAKYTDGATYGCPIADACICNGVYTWVTQGGQVYQENSATYLDAGASWVPLTVETAWYTANGPLAFKAIRSFQVEGISNTNHNLTISVGFDSETAYTQAKTFLAQTPVTTIGPLEQCEITIGPRRKCQHIRFKMQDASPTTGAVGTGQGPIFDMMGVEVGVKKGFMFNPAGKKG